MIKFGLVRSAWKVTYLMSSAIICERLLHGASRQRWRKCYNYSAVGNVTSPVLSDVHVSGAAWCVSDRYCGSNHPPSPRWSRREKRAGRKSRKSCEVQSTTLSRHSLPLVNTSSREEGCEAAGREARVVGLSLS